MKSRRQMLRERLKSSGIESDPCLISRSSFFFLNSQLVLFQRERRVLREVWPMGVQTRWPESTNSSGDAATARRTSRAREASAGHSLLCLPAPGILCRSSEAGPRGTSRASHWRTVDSIGDHRRAAGRLSRHVSMRRRAPGASFPGRAISHPPAPFRRCVAQKHGTSLIIARSPLSVHPPTRPGRRTMRPLRHS